MSGRLEEARERGCIQSHLVDAMAGATREQVKKYEEKVFSQTIRKNVNFTNFSFRIIYHTQILIGFINWQDGESERKWSSSVCCIDSLFSRGLLAIE